MTDKEIIQVIHEARWLYNAGWLILDHFEDWWADIKHLLLNHVTVVLCLTE